MDGGAGSDGGTRLTADDLRRAACAAWTGLPEPLSALLMVIVDVSGSMDGTAPGSTESKWTITQLALSAAFDALPASTAAGVLYYPNVITSPSTEPRPVDACVNTAGLVPIALLGAAGSNHRGLIAQSLRNARPAGGTPTHDAFWYALENGMKPAALQGNRFMLLITDGQPTFSRQCIGAGSTTNPVDEQPIVDEIAAARALGIRTFVIGSPGSEQNATTAADARPWLSRAASAGDTALPGCRETGPTFCHLDLTQAPDFALALREGLRRVTASLGSCVYALPAPPTGQAIDPATINLIRTPGTGAAAILPRSSAADCTDGWRLEANQRLVLCSNTCSQVLADAATQLELIFGCASQVQ